MHGVVSLSDATSYDKSFYFLQQYISFPCSLMKLLIHHIYFADVGHDYDFL